MIPSTLYVCVFLFVLVNGCNSLIQNQDEGVMQTVKTVTFLITVNDTWDENGCIKTVKTPPLVPGRRSSPITVGSCDHGPIDFDILLSNDGKSKMIVDFTFHSSVIVDASPPACKIPWNGTYLVPSKVTNELPSLLPGCLTMDSREGFHMTSYWFYLIDWVFE